MTPVAVSSPTARAIAFVLGLGTFTYVQVVGYMAISELLVGSIGVLWLLLNWQEWARRPANWFVGLLVAWLLSAVATDLIRGTPVAFYLRGWARVGFLGASTLVFFTLFRRDPWLTRPFFIGAAASSVISLFAFKGGATEVKEIVGGMMDITWKEMSWRDYYNYAFNIAVIALAASGFRRFPFSTSLLIAGFGVLNLVLGSRAAGGVQVMAGFTSLFLAFQLKSGESRARILAGKRMAILLGLTAVAAVCVLGTYKLAAARGWLGEEQQKRYELQSQSRLGIVFGGRVAFVAGTLALRDSPLIGYGSWAEDTGGYMAEAMALTGFVPDLEFMRQYEYRRIPTHSHVLEGWVEHGIGGGIFWIATAVFLVRFMTRCLFVVPGLVAIECILLWSFLWNIPFSPIGNRVFIGASLGLMLAIWSFDRAARAAQRNRLPASTAEGNTVSRALQARSH